MTKNLLCREHPEYRREHDYRNNLAYELRKLRRNGDTGRELAKNLLETEKYLEALEHNGRQKAGLQLAQNLIKEGQWRVVLHHLNIFEGLDFNLAKNLIEQKKGYEVCCNISSFKKSDHRLIAEKLLEISELSGLVRYLQYFEGLDDDFSTRLLEKMVKSRFIKSVDEYILETNKRKFKKGDINSVETWIKNMDMETATVLIDEGKKYIDKEYWESREDCINHQKNWYGLSCAKFALKLIKMLKEGNSMEDIRTEIYNRGDSYNAFCFWIAPIVVKYSRRGKEFSDYIESKL